MLEAWTINIVAEDKLIEHLYWKISPVAKEINFEVQNKSIFQLRVYKYIYFWHNCICRYVSLEEGTILVLDKLTIENFAKEEGMCVDMRHKLCNLDFVCCGH